MARSSSARRGRLVPSAAAMVSLVLLVGGAAALAASPSPAGAERVFDACPVSLDAAIAIAGEPMVPKEVYPGAPTFSGETVGGATTYVCGYSAPGDPSERSFTFSLSFSVDGSADARWAIYAESFLGPDNVRIDRVPGEAYERVWSEDPGALEVAVDTRVPAAFIASNVAAYGTQHTIDQVRAMADAWAIAAITGIEVSSGSPGAPPDGLFSPTTAP